MDGTHQDRLAGRSTGWPRQGYDKIHRLAFDEAVESGLLDRPYKFVLHAENGLPNGSARNATDGFKYLVDQGCIGVAGAYNSDNAITVATLANELQVPLISWAGTERLPGRILLSPRQRRLRRRRGAHRCVARETWAHSCGGS
jgi:hypothetical protein